MAIVKEFSLFIFRYENKSSKVAAVEKNFFKPKDLCKNIKMKTPDSKLLSGVFDFLIAATS